MKRGIVIAGSVAQRVNNGGHAWVFLQYLLGFKRLGFDVLFLDRIEPDMCTGPFASSANLAYLRDIMTRHGLGESFALFHDRGKDFVGRSRAEVIERVASAEFVLNVMGFFEDESILSKARRRVFLDIDPGFGQMWHELELATPFVAHDQYVTIGERIGEPDCEMPTCGIDWITTPQPIVLEHWPVVKQHNDAFTGISTWRGPFGPVEFNGKIYGLRVHEFRKFAALPKITNLKFELALDIHPSETNDIAMLRDNGWQLIDPQSIAADPSAYQRYIQNSMAEVMIAKNMYVQTRGGWFSDRSLCHLASGKPVLAQDTGFSKLYPTGEGLLAFNTIEEAAAGAHEIVRNHDKHAAAARRIAEQHFDSDKVLTKLLAKLGVAA